jgi:hypothetical protein
VRRAACRQHSAPKAELSPFAIHRNPVKVNVRPSGDGLTLNVGHGVSTSVDARHAVCARISPFGRRRCCNFVVRLLHLSRSDCRSSSSTQLPSSAFQPLQCVQNAAAGPTLLRPQVYNSPTTALVVSRVPVCVFFVHRVQFDHAMQNSSDFIAQVYN